jgi:hypothetical protein
MALIVVPYTDPKQPGSGVAYTLARTLDEVDAVVKKLQNQGYQAGPPIPMPLKRKC